MGHDDIGATRRGLRVVHGNHVAALLDALIDALPPPDPFAPVTIVVGSHVVERWLVRELALARGIAGGLELVTFDSFVEHTWAGDDAARAAGLVAIDKGQLAAAIASVLADGRAVARMPEVEAYLAAAPEQGDRAGPRRVQLAEHVATLAWNYALTRPEWMHAFVHGRVPRELEHDATARWQAALIGDALATACGDRTCAPVPTLPWARRRAGLPAPELARPVAVFGVSYLSRAQLDALSDLAATTEVTVYLLDPCAELWDDVSGRARAAPAADPLPLTLWGRAVRDTLGALVERTGGDLVDAFVTAPPRDARAHLLADVLQRAAAPTLPAPAAPGVQVLACPDPRRELEIVAAEVRRRLDADHELHARDIAVWLASDAERYLAQAPAAFEAVRVPWHLIDAPIDDRGRIGEAVLALLELPASALTRRDLLRVMTHPAVLAAHPHVDPDDWVRWTEKLGIAHGADHHAHARTYLAEHPDRFHWDQGVRRLALGAFMIGGARTAERGPAMIGGIEVAPEEVRPEQHASAATYALLVRSLCADCAWLAAHTATLTEWAAIFAGLVDTYLDRGATPRSRQGDTTARDDVARDVERVRAMLAGLAHVDLDGRRLGFLEAREHARRRLVTARANRGEPLAAGVMIAPLGAMRAIPHRVAFVVGLAEGAFPAADVPSPLDLRREPRAGDVSPRDRDRHAFLEILLGAGDRDDREHAGGPALYLSYVAIEPKGGQPLGPSSVVLELADALAPYLGAASSRLALERLTTHHPLHRWAAAGSLPPAVTRERWAVRVRDALRAHLRAHGHPVPAEDGLLALLAHPALAELRGELGLVDAAAPPPPAPPSRPLSLANVRAFLESPVQAWAQSVLGLDDIPDDHVIERSDEPFHVDAPTRAILLRDVLAAQLRAGAVDEAGAAACYDRVVRDLELRGQFPVGVFGAAARANDLRQLARWRAQLDQLGGGAAKRLAFGRSTSPSAELVPALELALPGGRTVRLVGQTELLVATDAGLRSVIPLLGTADKRSRYHLRGALDHVVLAAAGLASDGHEHVLLGKEGTQRHVQHAPWSRDDARDYLAALVGELLDAPHGYLLPFDHLVHALAGKPASSRSYPASDAPPALGYGPLDRADGLAAPPDAGAIAERRLGPLVQRMRGDHSLGGGDA